MESFSSLSEHIGRTFISINNRGKQCNWRIWFIYQCKTNFYHNIWTFSQYHDWSQDRLQTKPSILWLPTVSWAISCLIDSCELSFEPLTKSSCPQYHHQSQAAIYLPFIQTLLFFSRPFLSNKLPGWEGRLESSTACSDRHVVQSLVMTRSPLSVSQLHFLLPVPQNFSFFTCFFKIHTCPRISRSSYHTRSITEAR